MKIENENDEARPGYNRRNRSEGNKSRDGFVTDRDVREGLAAFGPRKAVHARRRDRSYQGRGGAPRAPLRVGIRREESGKIRACLGGCDQDVQGAPVCCSGRGSRSRASRKGGEGRRRGRPVRSQVRRGAPEVRVPRRPRSRARKKRLPDEGAPRGGGVRGNRQSYARAARTQLCEPAQGDNQVPQVSGARQDGLRGAPRRGSLLREGRGGEGASPFHPVARAHGDRERLSGRRAGDL